jgi:hypothetical protein
MGTFDLFKISPSGDKFMSMPQWNLNDKYSLFFLGGDALIVQRNKLTIYSVTGDEWGEELFISKKNNLFFSDLFPVKRESLKCHCVSESCLEIYANKKWIFSCCNLSLFYIIVWEHQRIMRIFFMQISISEKIYSSQS